MFTKVLLKKIFYIKKKFLVKINLNINTLLDILNMIL